jgi:hypothetical protein
MSTELFRRYINILNESTDQTQLTTALDQLDAVLDKYKDKIYESLTEAPRTPEQQAQMDALRRGATAAPAAAPGELPRGGTRNPTRDWRSERTVKDMAAREAQEVLQQQEIARLKKDIAELQRVANGELKPGTTKNLKRIALTLAAGAALYLAPKAWDLVTGVYQSFVKYKFQDLAPGDQEIINKNISIIQPYYEQKAFSQLPSSLQTRLITVAVQLGKLKASLTLPNNQLPLTRSQEIDAAHGLNVNESAAIMTQMQQLTQLSDVEQMAVLRALVNEDWYDDAKSAYKSTVDTIDSAISSAWNSDTLRYLGWPTALWTVSGLSGLYSSWQAFLLTKEAAAAGITDLVRSGVAAALPPATPGAPAAPATAAPDTGPRILGPDGQPLPSSRTPVPTVAPPELGKTKPSILSEFRKYLQPIIAGKRRALKAALGAALSAFAGFAAWTGVAVNTGKNVAQDVSKWAGNDEDRRAEQVISRMSDLNSKGQFWDDNFVSEKDRKNMLEVVIAYCNKHPKYQGCDQKDNLCSLMPGLQGC